MPKENKVLRMFKVLTEKYDAIVGTYGVQEGDDRSFVLNITEYGMKFSFDSKNDRYRNFLMSVAEKELGEVLSPKNIRDLNTQLESIAQVIRVSEVCKKGCGCACDIDEKLDDE